ncbi:MAG: hypothetical protein QXK63_04965 [Thermoproteus sp.]
MRWAVLLPLLAVLALSAQTYQILIGPNRTVPVVYNGSLIVNGTVYNMPQGSYTWLPLPSTAKTPLAIIGLSYPFSACTLQQSPYGFYISCPQNAPMTVVYVASPGYSLYCDQQPISQQAQDLVKILQYNALRLNCKLVSGAISPSLNPPATVLAAALGAVTLALGVIVAGLMLVVALRRREGVESSR